MSSNSYTMYLIETLTNMHVGSGDTHFGVVDNLIQRDPVTKVPIIHASGIKGALREYFEEEKKFHQAEIVDLFGGKIVLDKDASKELTKEEKNENKKKIDFSPGHLIFFEASLLTLPLRSNYNVFYQCTSVKVLRAYLEQIMTFFPNYNTDQITKLDLWVRTLNPNTQGFLYFDGIKELEIEDYSEGFKIDIEQVDAGIDLKASVKSFFKVDLQNLAIFNDSTFTRICESSIPVIARNQIKDDGTSGNLFYEEILPRKSQLYFLLGADSSIQTDPALQKINKEFNNPDNIYQFGGNYSIGYGFSKIHKVV